MSAADAGRAHGGASASSRPGGASRAGRRRRLLIPLTLLLAGIIVLLYPVLATTYNNQRQHEFAREHQARVTQASPERLAASLQRAREYNATLPGVPILDPWLTQAADRGDNGPYNDYLHQLDDFEAMARLRAPKAGIDLPVRHGTAEDSLRTGAGHLYGSSLPVGGPSTHAVMTSHTGIASATLFDHLRELHEGDQFYIDVHGETLAYAVDQIKVVEPTEVSDLTVQPGEDLVTLFTCTPYGVNSHRLLVRGHRVPYDAARDQHETQRSTLHLEGWMWPMLAGAAAGAVLLAVMVRRERRSRRASTQQAL